MFLDYILKFKFMIKFTTLIDAKLVLNIILLFFFLILLYHLLIHVDFNNFISLKIINLKL